MMEISENDQLDADKTVQLASQQFQQLLELALPLGCESETSVFYESGVFAREANLIKKKVFKNFVPKLTSLRNECKAQSSHLELLRVTIGKEFWRYVEKQNSQYAKVAEELHEILEEVSETAFNSKQNPNPAHSKELLMENQRLKISALDFQQTIDELKIRNAILEAKSIETEKMLEIEKQKSTWQRHLFENRIRQLMHNENANELASNKTLSSLENHNSTAKYVSGNFSLLSLRSKHSKIRDMLQVNIFSETTTTVLLLLEKTHAEEVENLNSCYERKLGDLMTTHDQTVTEIIEKSSKQVKKLQSENTNLIRKLSEFEVLVDQLKKEYNDAIAFNLKGSVKCNEDMIRHFTLLPAVTKAVIVGTISAIYIATAGWASWGFIMWSKLICQCDIKLIIKIFHKH